MINFTQYISEIPTDTFSSIIHNPLKAFFFPFDNQYWDIASIKVAGIGLPQ